MTKIYCLIMPDTNTPFYVGATGGSLSMRLSNHIHTALHNKDSLNWPDHGLIFFPRIKRNRTINRLLNECKRPKIVLLLEVDSSAVDFYEEFFYSMFKGQGYDMQQEERKFQYQSTRKTKKRNQNSVIVLFDKYQQNTLK